MRRSNRLIILLLGAVPLAAQAALPQRTFVASNGVDTNPCTLTAPCRSFGTAVAGVADGGEVIVLDSAGYGAVTIGRSVSIVAPPGVYAGVSALSSSGVIVDGAGIDVVLRGLTINAQGGGPGIEFLQGNSLHVESGVVSGFEFSMGIDVKAPASATYLDNTVIRNCNYGIVFEAGLVGQITRTRIENNALYGIYVLGGVMLSIEDSAITGSANNVDVSPNAFSAQPQVTIARSLLSGGNYGVFAGPTAGLATAYVTIMDSTISKAALAGIAAVQSSGPPAAVAMAIRNQLQGNLTGILAMGAGARVIIDGNSMASNGTGVNSSGGATIVTRGNNAANSNGVDTANTPYMLVGGV